MFGRYVLLRFSDAVREIANFCNNAPLRGQGIKRASMRQHADLYQKDEIRPFGWQNARA